MNRKLRKRRRNSPQFCGMKTKEKLIKNLSDFRLQRTHELSFIDAENPLRKIKSSTVIVQPGYEGVLVTYENGKEIFVFADDISNFWKY